jgi:hypothetical protein
VGKDDVTIAQLDPEHGPREDFDDFTLSFYGLLWHI